MSSTPRNNRIAKTGGWKDPWRWLVATPPLAAVLAGGAIDSWDGLVVDDYYKQGLEINQVLARDEKAQQMGLGASVRWEPEGREGTLVVIWDGGPGNLAPPSLAVKLIYATREGLDQEVTATLSAPQRYEIRLPALHSGQWHVHLGGDGWRITDELFIGEP
jgi:hypothetical protein